MIETLNLEIVDLIKNDKDGRELKKLQEKINNDINHIRVSMAAGMNQADHRMAVLRLRALEASKEVTLDAWRHFRNA
ncbi:MAG: hypothetical protein HWE34_17610 [Methylocystaceae bacterium]|nr:hypothetical protein [Methylocystaceae bacterium]